MTPKVRMCLGRQYNMQRHNNRRVHDGRTVAAVWPVLGAGAQVQGFAREEPQALFIVLTRSLWDQHAR